ncbi:unnamed protein product [Bursaphelenchus xylophilus]|uniref:(pine wood nematode) hypothetical protein n=1 Tax=Bursaphelenchus xylophilus TaxID=6326 RepID=A0A1I7S3J5_BURXY|nr:unnamed protein product [Bursaphelenchus xylophilus]CAG9116352.1 unnamed protein product [Bursaphelenchus xylophilus]
MWESAEGASVADMVVQAAKEHLVSTNLPGFVFHEESGMYYNRETGYYYDMSSNLYFHPITQCYYQYDADTGQYKSFSTRNLQWKEKRNKKRAIKLFGENYLQNLDQDYIDGCEVLFEIVNKLCVEFSHRSFNLKNVRKDEDEIEFDDVLEEDEDTSSDEYDYDAENKRRQAEEEMSKHPPCIRLINAQTSDLSIITIDGGSVGSSTICDVIVPDELPERYLTFKFDDSCNFYNVVKLSDHQIYVNEQEITESHTLRHLDRLKVRSHQFVAHIHKGCNTCPDCEPGLLISKKKSVVKTKSTISHRKEMHRLKSQFGLIGPSSAYNETCFKDRAKQRRLVEGSEPPVTVRSDDIYANCKANPIQNFVHITQKPKPIEEGKGFKLLKAMGWKQGAGLGRNEQGIAEPIRSEIKNDRSGLGSSKPGEPIHIPAKQKMKIEILEKTKQRYEQIRPS